MEVGNQRLDNTQHNAALHLIILSPVGKGAEFPQTAEKSEEAQFVTRSVVKALGTPKAAEEVLLELIYRTSRRLALGIPNLSLGTTRRRRSKRQDVGRHKLTQQRIYPLVE